MDTFAQADAQANGFQRAYIYKKAKQFFDAASSEERAKSDWEKVKKAEVDYSQRIAPNALPNVELEAASYRRHLDLLFQWCDSRGFRP